MQTIPLYSAPSILFRVCPCCGCAPQQALHLSYENKAITSLRKRQYLIAVIFGYLIDFGIIGPIKIHPRY